MIPRALLTVRAAAVVLVLSALLAAPPAWAKKSLAPGERVDLNRASVSELMRLPGVGEKRAQAIVAYRARQPFRRPEEVVRVKGLGRSWYGKVKANLVAGAVPAAHPPARR